MFNYLITFFLQKEVEETRKKLVQRNELQTVIESLRNEKAQIEQNLRQEIEQLKNENTELKTKIDTQPNLISPSSDAKGDKLVEDGLVKDPSYRSKFNVDTDIEGGVKPQIPGEQDIPLAKPASPQSLNKTASLQAPSEEDKKSDGLAADTNISKEVQDELPSPNKITEDEISDGRVNDQKSNQINEIQK